MTPTISVTTGALTLPPSGSSSLSLSFSAAPDRVDVTGQPSGLSAALSGNLLTLTAQNVTAGAYTLTLTGVWGSQKASAALNITVSPTSSGYTWYVGTDHAASAEELEVLRLTNDVRASGANCEGIGKPLQHLLDAGFWDGVLSRKWEKLGWAINDQHHRPN